MATQIRITLLDQQIRLQPSISPSVQGCRLHGARPNPLSCRLRTPKIGGNIHQG